MRRNHDLALQKFTVWRVNTFPDLRKLAFMVPNDGKVSESRGAIEKTLGKTRGIPDYMFLYKGKTRGVELKIDKDSQSDDQMETERVWTENQIDYVVVYGKTVGEAVELLKECFLSFFQLSANVPKSNKKSLND